MTLTQDEIIVLTSDKLQLEIARLKGWKLIYMNVDNSRVWASLNSIGTTAKTDIEAIQIEGDTLGIKTNWPTDIAAAWELVEEIRQDGRDIGITYSKRWFDGTSGWMCDVGGKTGFETVFSFVGETAMESICRAYLEYRQRLKELP